MKKTSKKTQTRHATPNCAARLVARSGSASYTARPQADHQKEIRAEQFTLVDGEGKDRAHLAMRGEEAVLAMRDQSGALRLTIRASEGEASITIYAGDKGYETEGVTIGYERAGQESRVVVRDREEREYSRLASAALAVAA